MILHRSALSHCLVSIVKVFDEEECHLITLEVTNLKEFHQRRKENTDRQTGNRQTQIQKD